MRKRRNRTQLQVNAFAKQLECMADAYLDLGVAVAEGDGLAASYDVPGEELDGRDILVVDVFSASSFFFLKKRHAPSLTSNC